MRQRIIAGNWKLNKTITEAIELVVLLKRENFGMNPPVVVVCPVFTAITEVSEQCAGSGIKVGGQNLYWEEKGAFTGEVSGSLLKDAGCEYVIIGHSERRQFFGETDDSVNLKVKSALTQTLLPIICCGEVLEEREGNLTNQILDRHIRGAFKGVSAEDAARTVIAYEPVWAIGTGKVATPEQAQDAHAFIRNILVELYSDEVASAVPILYGGSVKPENALEILKKPDVDGALVGGASLKAGDFAGIIRASSEAGA
ncbi:MAG: triose-phosphate isomerase [Candidatus Omnitrophica bacterium]|nr:triose-phosphate isomerase [Candidatus Omnitrophota bacterium]